MSANDLLEAPAIAEGEAGSTSPVSGALRDVAPILVALLPFALAIGSASAANGLSAVEAVLGALFLLAGSAQLAAVGLIGSGAALALVATTAIVINLRFMIYSVAFARWFDEAPRLHRLAMAIPLVDQSFVLCVRRFGERTDLAWRRHYYLTVSASLVVVFTGGQVIGYFAGAGVPPGLGLHLAAPLVFAAMLATKLDGLGGAAAAVSSALVFVVLVGLPGGLALPVAVVVAVIVGSLADRSGDDEEEARAS